MDRFGASAADLMAQAAKRQHELKDPVLRDDLAGARAVLRKHSMMLLTASKVRELVYMTHDTCSEMRGHVAGENIWALQMRNYKRSKKPPWTNFTIFPLFSC